MNEKLPKILFCGKELEPFGNSHHFVMDSEVLNAIVYLSSDKNRENKIFESNDVKLCIQKAFEQKEDADVVVYVVHKTFKEHLTIHCEVTHK